MPWKPRKPHINDIKPYNARPNWVAADRIDDKRKTDTYDVKLLDRMEKEAETASFISTVNKPLVLGDWETNEVFSDDSD